MSSGHPRPLLIAPLPRRGQSGQEKGRGEGGHVSAVSFYGGKAEAQRHQVTRPVGTFQLVAGPGHRTLRMRMVRASPNGSDGQHRGFFDITRTLTRRSVRLCRNPVRQVESHCEVWSLSKPQRKNEAERKAACSPPRVAPSVRQPGTRCCLPVAVRTESPPKGRAQPGPLSGPEL